MHCTKHIGYFRIWTADHTTYLCTLVLYSFPLTVAINWGLPCYIYVNLNLIYDLTYTGQKQRCKKLRNYKSKHECAIYGNLPIFIVLWTVLSTFRKRHFPFSYLHTKGLVKIQKSTWYLGFASPYIIILSIESTNKMQQTSQVHYLSFKYSSTCFGHPHAHHQELQQLQ